MAIAGTYVKGGYNVFDTSKYPMLKQLREDLFNKNDNIKYLINKLDDSRMLLDGWLDDTLLTRQHLSNSSYIYFSPDTPETVFVSYSRKRFIHDIIDIILSIDDINPITKSDLSEIMGGVLYGECFRNKDEYEVMKSILEKIVRIIGSKISEIDKNTLEDIGKRIDGLRKKIKSSRKRYKLYGLYIENDGPNPYIILFLNNILNLPCGNTLFSMSDLYNGKEIKPRIEGVYAHEMFHYIQFGQEFVFPNVNYGDKVVVEGLAKYFEIKYKGMFCKANEKDEFADLAIDSVVFNPYVGACYVENYGQNVFGKIVEASSWTYPHYGLHILLRGTKELEEIIRNI